MSAFFDVFIKSSLIFSFVAGLLGVFLFSVMIMSLDLLRDLGNFFNKSFPVKKIEKKMNSSKNIDDTFFKYSKVFGVLIIAGGLYIFYALLKGMKIEAMKTVFNISDVNWPFILALLKTIWLFTLVSVIAGIIFGLLLIADTDVAKDLSSLFNKWYDYDEIEQRLDDTVLKDTDTICFLHNKIVGIFGLTASVFLLILSSINLYKIFFK